MNRRSHGHHRKPTGLNGFHSLRFESIHNSDQKPRGHSQETIEEPTTPAEILEPTYKPSRTAPVRNNEPNPYTEAFHNEAIKTRYPITKYEYTLSTTSVEAVTPKYEVTTQGNDGNVESETTTTSFSESANDEVHDTAYPVELVTESTVYQSPTKLAHAVEPTYEETTERSKVYNEPETTVGEESYAELETRPTLILESANDEVQDATYHEEPVTESTVYQSPTKLADVEEPKYDETTEETDGYNESVTTTQTYSESIGDEQQDTTYGKQPVTKTTEYQSPTKLEDAEEPKYAETTDQKEAYNEAETSTIPYLESINDEQEDTTYGQQPVTKTTVYPSPAKLEDAEEPKYEETTKEKETYNEADTTPISYSESISDEQKDTTHGQQPFTETRVYKSPTNLEDAVEPYQEKHATIYKEHPTKQTMQQETTEVNPKYDTASEKTYLEEDTTFPMQTTGTVTNASTDDSTYTTEEPIAKETARYHSPVVVSDRSNDEETPEAIKPKYEETTKANEATYGSMATQATYSEILADETAGTFYEQNPSTLSKYGSPTEAKEEPNYEEATETEYGHETKPAQGSNSKENNQFQEDPGSEADQPQPGINGESPPVHMNQTVKATKNDELNPSQRKRYEDFYNDHEPDQTMTSDDEKEIEHDAKDTKKAATNHDGKSCQDQRDCPE